MVVFTLRSVLNDLSLTALLAGITTINETRTQTSHIRAF